MSTKRLDRTVIEGGRVGTNKEDRRQSSQEDRVRTKQYLHKVKEDPDYWDDSTEPVRTKVNKEFNDKLSPMYRWLDAQIGRPWSEVRSEVFKKFDTRTTAGRHVTFDHLLYSVVDTASGFNTRGEYIPGRVENYVRSQEYYVDHEGILCKTPYEDAGGYVTREEREAVCEWLDGRILGKKKGKYYWFIPTDGIWKVQVVSERHPKWLYYGDTIKYCLWDVGEYKVTKYSEFLKIHYDVKKHGNHWKPIDKPFSFKQRHAISKEDVEFFEKLNPRLQKEILAFGKGR